MRAAAATGARPAPSVLRPWAIDHAPVSSELPAGARLAINSTYFDTLLSLIPPKYYLRTEEDDEADAGPGSKFHVKKKGAAAGVAAGSLKESTKAAKKLRYTQEHAKSIPQLQQEMADAARSDDEDDEEENDDDKEGAGGAHAGHKRKRPDDADDGDGGLAAGAAPSGPSAASHGSAPASSLEDLRARLAAKIAAHRVGRRADDDDAQAARDKRKSKKEARKKSKRKESKAAADGSGGAPAQAAGSSGKPASAPAPKPVPAPTNDFAQLDFAFSATATGGGLPGAGGGKLAAKGGKPGMGGAGAAGGAGKVGKLKALLAAATKRQEALERATAAGGASHADAPAGPNPKLAATFESALKRAEGGKVMDDPKLLAKSLKRLQKQKAASAAAWDQRKSTQNDESTARVTQRNANLQKKRSRGVNEMHQVKSGKAREGGGGKAGGGGGSGGFSGKEGGGKKASPGFK